MQNTFRKSILNFCVCQYKYFYAKESEMTCICYGINGMVQLKKLFSFKMFEMPIYILVMRFHKNFMHIFPTKGLFAWHI